MSVNSVEGAPGEKPGVLAQIFEIAHSRHAAISAMEGLRGVAAFMVFLIHFATYLEPQLVDGGWPQLIGLFFRNIGNAGVDLFFVLSGYLIYGSLLRRKVQHKTYFYRRVQRIYPAYMVIFFVYLLISLLVPSYGKLPAEVMDAVIYIIQSFLLLPGLYVDSYPLVGVAWSLSYEMTFYLAVPLAIVLFDLRAVSSNRRLQALAFIALVGFGFAYFYDYHSRLLMFVAGMLLYEVIKERQVVSMNNCGLLIFIGSLAAIYLLMVFGIDNGSWWRLVIMFLCFPIICYECFTQRSLLARLMSLRYLRYFGNMSYSYYLAHGLCVKVFFIAFFYIFPVDVIGFELFALLLIPAFIATLVPSALLFIWVEKPYSLLLQK